MSINADGFEIFIKVLFEGVAKWSSLKIVFIRSNEAHMRYVE